VNEFLKLSSRKTDRWVAGSLLIIFLIVAWILMTGDSEPRYEGRALSTWLEDLDEGKASEVRERAKAVLTKAAGKAAPRFVRTLRAKDSKLKFLVIGLAQRQNVINLRFRTAAMRREQALADFSRFGVGAIPVLTNLLENDPALAVEAARTMSGIGPEAAVHLIRALDHTNDWVRFYAAVGLGSIYENCVRFKNLVTARQGWEGTFPTNAVVTLLIKRLKDVKPEVSAFAAFALA
jgi:HEAT repeat protein